MPDPCSHPNKGLYEFESGPPESSDLRPGFPVATGQYVFRPFRFCPECGANLESDTTNLQWLQHLNTSFSGDASAANRRVYRESTSGSDSVQ